jgi:hypothetical protein
MDSRPFIDATFDIHYVERMLKHDAQQAEADRSQTAGAR